MNWFSRGISADLKNDPEGTLRPKEFFSLYARTWPYMKPQLVHLVFWVVAVLLIEALFVVSMLIGSDLFNNKVIEAEKLEPQQAKMLLLTDDYIGDPVEDEPSKTLRLSEDSAQSGAFNHDQKLTQTQRRMCSGQPDSPPDS